VGPAQEATHQDVFAHAALLAGIYAPALDGRFLQAASEQEAAVMVRHLGVAAPSAARVYRDVLLPQLQSLSEDIRDAAMLRMLSCLVDLQQQDRSFTQLLAQVRCCDAACCVCLAQQTLSPLGQLCSHSWLQSLAFANFQPLQRACSACHRLNSTRYIT
jgi:hypothetical protein